jgi:hypothetical protein
MTAAKFHSQVNFQNGCKQVCGALKRHIGGIQTSKMKELCFLHSTILDMTAEKNVHKAQLLKVFERIMQQSQSLKLEYLASDVWSRLIP